MILQLTIMIEINIVGLRPILWYMGTKMREPAQKTTTALPLVMFLILIDCSYRSRREDLDYLPAVMSRW